MKQFRWFVAVVVTTIGVGSVPIAADATRFSMVRTRPPLMTLQTATGLQDGQTLSVQGRRLLPFEPLRFLECNGACGHWTSTEAVADRHGRVDVAVTLSRYIQRDPVEWDDPAADCAYDGCSLAIVRPDYRTEWPDGYPKDRSHILRAAVPIEFAPVPNATPSASVTPINALPPMAPVAVHAEHFTPGGSVRALQCRSIVGVAGPNCNGNFEGQAIADSSGAATITLTVARTPGGDGDCLAVGEVCTLRLFDAAHRNATVPLMFDHSISLPSRAAVSIDPGPVSGVTGSVGVHAAGFGPLVLVRIEQCWSIGTGSKRCGPPIYTNASDAGAVAATIAVSRYSRVLIAPLIDCANVACTIEVTDVRDDGPLGLFGGSAALTFRSDPAVPVLRLVDGVVSEGGPGAHDVKVTAQLDRPAVRPASFIWGGAGFGIGFIPAGAASTTFTITVTGDSGDGLDRSESVFLVGVENVQPDPNHTSARLMVLDDDPPPTVEIGPAILSESAGTATVPVRLSNPGGVAIAYRTRRGSARGGEDYVTTFGVQDVRTGGLDITIPIINDGRAEGAEFFTVEIVMVEGGVLATRRAVVWIGDDDA